MCRSQDTESNPVPSLENGRMMLAGVEFLNAIAATQREEILMVCLREAALNVRLRFGQTFLFTSLLS